MIDRKFERVEFLSSEDGHAHLLIDLSTAGAAFLFSRELKPDTRINLRLNSIAIDALVVYCHQRANDGFRIGTHFRNVTPEMQRSLDELVNDFSRGAAVVCEIHS